MVGVGAVALPVPPLTTVFHLSDDPVAVRAVAVAFWQYTTGLVTVGAAGVGVTFTAMVARGLSQPLTV